MTPQKYLAILASVMALLLVAVFIEMLHETATGRGWLLVIGVSVAALVLMAGRFVLTGSLP